MRIGVNRRRVVTTLAVAAGLLVVIGIAAATLRAKTDFHVRGLVLRLDLSTDSSIPTWFSAAMLALGALLLLAVGLFDRAPGARMRRGWIGLAAVLTFMSVDEVAMLHEWSGGLVTARTGYLYFTWVLVGVGAVVLLAACFSRFVLSQPSPFRWLLMISAATYVGGGLGMEMLNARVAEDPDGVFSVRYVIGTACEEALEMTGAILLVHALLGRLTDLGAELRISPSVQVNPASGRP